jgi:DNA recombination protein RmuC
MKDHAKHIRKHIDDLSKKSYWQQFQPSPDFVVLFLPGEHFFAAALEADPELIEVGVSQNVIIATPTTLIALLRSASYGWQQERLAENVRQVGKIGQELYRRVADMSEHFVRLGKNLNQSVDAYNRAMGTLESRVLVSARKMNELNGLTGKDEIPELFLVETQARQLTTPESEGPGQT